jgi:hypothetical protein
MVPALDLRTVAVGGGSMLRADKALFGPRSAHIAGLPYLFQALQRGLTFVSAERWTDPQRGGEYVVARMNDGSLAAFTMTDMRLGYVQHAEELVELKVPAELVERLREGLDSLGKQVIVRLRPTVKDEAILHFSEQKSSQGKPLSDKELVSLRHTVDDRDEVLKLNHAFVSTTEIVVKTVMELAKAHRADLTNFTLVGGGGGAPVILRTVAAKLGLKEHCRLIEHHSVISAIGAALAVTCVSMSRSVAQPGPGDVAELTQAVEAKLREQGAERVSTDFQFDPQMQVLTVSGRGSRPYEANAQPRSDANLAQIVAGQLGGGAELAWRSPESQLWLGPGTARKRSRKALALSRSGRILWLGELSEWLAAEAGEIEKQLAAILDSRIQYTDGGPALPGLALIADGRLILLDQLGSRELAMEVLRWEGLPAGAQGCFILRRLKGL